MTSSLRKKVNNASNTQYAAKSDTVPEDKLPDGYINISIVDANGRAHRLPRVVVSLHEGYNRPIDDAIMAKMNAYNKALEKYEEQQRSGNPTTLTEPDKPEFHFVGEVVLRKPDEPIRF